MNHRRLPSLALLLLELALLALAALLLPARQPPRASEPSAAAHCDRPLTPNAGGTCFFHSQSAEHSAQDRHVFARLGGAVDAATCAPVPREDFCRRSRFAQEVVRCECTAPNASVFGRRFVEVGAVDGLYRSNTAFFEFQMGWSGVCVEASPVSFGDLAKNRPRCHAVNAVVGEELAGRNTSFFTFEKMGWEIGQSGVSRSSASWLRTRESAERHAKSIGAQLRVDEVPGVRLKDVFVDAQVKEVAWASVDVGGQDLQVQEEDARSIGFGRQELQVLETWDIDAVPVELVSLHGRHPEVHGLVTKKWGLRETPGPKIDSWFERVGGRANASAKS